MEMNDPKCVLERARLRRVEFEQHIKELDKDLESEAQELLKEKQTDLTAWNPSKNENDDKENSLSPSKYGLRNAVKLKLDKLGKLYAGEEVSSPIHKSLENERSPLSAATCGKLSQARSARLAALANTINNWEDDLSRCKKESPTKVTHGAPRPLGERNVRSVHPIAKKIESQNEDKKVVKPPNETKKLVIVDAVVKTLEAQGFQRCESKQHLVYDYSSPNNSPGRCLSKPVSTSPVKSPNKCNSRTNRNTDLKDICQATNTPQRIVQTSQACGVLKMAAKYEGSPKKAVARDPAELSLADRKALFERGDNGAAILPKAPFAMAVPTKMLRSDNKSNSPKASNSKSTPGGVRTQLNSWRTPELVKVETVERPKVGDNVTKEILERRKEIEDLRNRWEKKKVEFDVDKNEGVRRLHHTQKSSPDKNIPAPPPLPVHSDTKGSTNSSSLFKNDSLKNALLSPTSPSKRERKTSVSPGVIIALEGVKPIKVSPPKALYPSITDIETDSDMMEEDRQSYLDTISENSEDRISYESEGLNEIYESSLESANSSLSFGKHIVASSRENSRSNLKRPADQRSSSFFFNQPTSPNDSNSTSGTHASEISKLTADESKVLHEIDDFLDEALGEPTPPKKIREENKKVSCLQLPSSPLVSDPEKQCTTSKVMTTPEENRLAPKEKAEVATPLVYTVSLYRKQQTSLIKTPLKRDVHTDIVDMEVEPQEDCIAEEEIVKKRMEELQIEIKRQVTVISQASQALNLCMSSIEFSGSAEELEAEKLLLLATARRMAATHELERLTVEKKLYPGEKSEFNENGILKLESISVKAKRVPSALDETIHLLCLVKSGCSVQATEILPLARQALTDNNRLLFKKPIQIEQARHNMQTTIEVYAITNKGFMNLHHLRGEKEKLKMTPKKSGKKESKRHFGVIESPAGPNAIRSPSFHMIGYVVFSLKDISRHHFTLNKVPGNAPIEGFLEMKVKGQVNLDNLRHEGFLTLFQEIGGFGAWKRAWSILRGHHLSFCSYPDPERALASCFETIDLSECITREVGLAPKDVCVRSDTVMLECKRIGKETQIIRYLLSADSLQERLEWCKYINKVLSLLRLWDPAKKI